jgi:hypothetical protein
VAAKAAAALIVLVLVVVLVLDRACGLALCLGAACAMSLGR